MHPQQLAKLLPAAILLLFVRAALSEDAAADWHLHQEHRAWLQAFDPTLLSPRLLAKWEHKDFIEGNTSDKVLVNIRESFLLTDSLAFGIQAELPVSWAERSGSDFSGLGDFEMRAGIVGRVNPKLRWALAMNTRFDTATEAPLGAGGLEWRPIGTLRWDVLPWLNLGVQPEYTFTPDRPAEFFQLKLPVAIELSESLAAEVVYQPEWRLGDEDRRVDMLEVSLNWRFGKQRRYGMIVGMEIPLSDDDLDWKSFVGLQWFFR